MKGYQRKMVCLKQTGSELFEEAYFVLRDQAQKCNSEEALLKEANRIVSSQSWKEKGPSQKKEKLVWGGCGAALACLVFCLYLWLLRG